MDDTIRVLVADDSAYMRKLVSSVIEQDERFEVVLKARNGLDAIDKLKNSQIDILVMDLDMPEMDGEEALIQMKTFASIPIIIYGDFELDQQRIMDLGATAYILKEQLLNFSNGEFARLVGSEDIVEDEVELGFADVTVKKEILSIPNKLMIIGSSTGGPSALQTILLDIEQEVKMPIFIIQHMPVSFTRSLAERLNQICPKKVKEVEDQEFLRDDTIYIAPAGIQSMIKQTIDGQLQVQLKEIRTSSSYMPSIDYTLSYVSEFTNISLLVVILTGMGDDGLIGCKKVSNLHPEIIAQSKETCIIYGMPKVIIEQDLATKVIDLPNIANEITQFYYE